VSVTTELRTFILDELAAGRELTTIGPDDDLLSRGIIDSLAVMQLVEFLDGRFGVTVGPDDLLPGNFRDLRSLEAFVERRRSEAPC
jgi:acyl carrier protein